MLAWHASGDQVATIEDGEDDVAANRTVACHRRGQCSGLDGLPTVVTTAKARKGQNRKRAMRPKG